MLFLNHHNNFSRAQVSRGDIAEFMPKFTVISVNNTGHHVGMVRLLSVFKLANEISLFMSN